MNKEDAIAFAQLLNQMQPYIPPIWWGHVVGSRAVAYITSVANAPPLELRMPPKPEE